MEDPPVVIQNPYPADLDPLNEQRKHLLLTLPNLNVKDPSVWCLRGLYGWVIGIE
jgi:hypothetical protein